MVNLPCTPRSLLDCTGKHNRTLSKIIKNEARAEKIALDVALKELGEIQKMQKAAVKVSYSDRSFYSLGI